MTTALTREVPLPGMPEVPPLWAVCVHTRNNIDIRAMSDRPAADKEAFGINDWLEAVQKRPDYEDKVAAGLITWDRAEVIEWPFSPETHAEELARQAEEDA